MAEVLVSFPVFVIGDEATYAEDPNTGLVATDSGPQFLTITAGDDLCSAVFPDRAKARSTMATPHLVLISKCGTAMATVADAALPREV
jgi:hypothetical protein